MSEEYISRKAVRDAIAALAIRRLDLSDAYKVYIEALENVDDEVVNIPTAHVVPVMRGVESNMFDIVEEHDNCHVQILRNSVTGEISVGWWKEEE